MYKNFKISEEEKENIMEQHRLMGYKRPMNESVVNENVLTDEDLGIKIMNVYCKAPDQLKSRMGKGTAVGNLLRGGSGPDENFLKKIKDSLDDALSNQSAPDSKLYDQVGSKFKNNEEIINFVTAVGINRPYPNSPCSTKFPMGMK
jgi:uncharacterized protein with ParB-like and HNH nuclease domain